MGSLLVSSIPQGAQAAVMATGIVSVGLELDGSSALSLALLALAGLVWAALVLVELAPPLRRRRPPAAASAAMLTTVAATAVIGTRLSLLGWQAPAFAALGLSVAMWLALVPRVLRTPEARTTGTSFLLTVATEAVAALAALLAGAERAGWLGVASLAPLVLGIAGYLFVLARFDLRELLAGRGDQWVAGGALAIASLACANAAYASRQLDVLAGAHRLLDGAALGLWAAAVAWLPALLLAEAVARRGGFDARRWSTVFPVAMYAASGLLVGGADGIGALREAGRVWVWIGFAVWALVAAGAGARALALARPALRG